MSEIRRFSKEWFAKDANSQQIEAAKNLQNGVDKCKGGFSDGFFVGDKESLKQKISELPSSVDKVMNRYGGLDNVFNLLDADGDGIISRDELDAAAAINTKESAEIIDADKNFSVKDLDLIYKNAMAADGAVVSEHDNVIKYKFKDGSYTYLELGEDGHVAGKTIHDALDSNNEKHSVKYDYDTKTKYEQVKDANGRVRFFSADAPGKKNDRKIVTNYLNDKNDIRIIQKTTAGKIITQTVNDENKVVYSSTILRYSSDGVVDNTKQHDVGDCWVLAGVNALNDTPAGKQMIKNAIKHHPDGSVTVELKGVNKSYTFTPDEIGAHDYTDLSKEMSTGDIDMNIIEMAFEAYRKEIIPADKSKRVGALALASPEDPLRGGYKEDTIKILTGKSSKEAHLKRSVEKMLDKKFNNPDAYALMCNFKEDDSSMGDIINNHAYSIRRVTEDSVIVINPWDSSEEIVYPKDKFLENCNSTSIVSFE